MENPKILILTCNTGGGHNSVAAAIQESFSKKGVTCDIEDGLSFISKRLSRFISRWHTRIYRKMPDVFRTGYGYADKTINDATDEKDFVYQYLSIGSRKLFRKILKGGYSAVVCVHVIPALMLTAMKKKFSSEIPSCFVATDYTCSPLVNECDVDFFAIPTEDLAEEFASCGIPEEKLFASGIPVRSEFYEPRNKEASLLEIGLPEDCRHVLLMSGSIGCGPMKSIAKQLDKTLPDDVKISVICGKNRRMLASMLLYPFKRVRAFGFTKEVRSFMESADLVVTKPGGISITEACSKGIPLLLLDIVGGCETHNINYFCEKGWAFGSSAKEAAKEIQRLIENPEQLAEKSFAAKEAFSENSADRLAEKVLEII